MDLKDLFNSGAWDHLMGGDGRDPHPAIEKHLDTARKALLDPDISDVKRGMFIGVIQYNRWLTERLPSRILGKQKEDESDTSIRPQRVAAISGRGWPR